MHIGRKLQVNLKRVHKVCVLVSHLHSRYEVK